MQIYFNIVLNAFTVQPEISGTIRKVHQEEGTMFIVTI